MAEQHGAKRHDIDLSSAARLELGLAALDADDIAAAVGALAAIPEDDWQAILRRFPTLPAYIVKEMN